MIKGNIFQTKRIMNAQTINQNRFSLRFIDLTNKLDKIDSWQEKRPELFWKYQSLKGAMQWRSTGTDKTVTPDKGLSEYEDILEISLLSATFPEVQAETQSLARMNDSTRALTKIAEMDNVTVSFYDYVNGSASTILEIWRSMVFDKITGAMGLKRDYMVNYALLFVYGPDAPGLAPPNGETFDKDNGWVDGWIQAYKVINIYPTQVNLGEHSTENGEARKVEATFAVDNMYQIGAKYYDPSSKTYVSTAMEDDTENYYKQESTKHFPNWTSNGVD